MKLALKLLGVALFLSFAACGTQNSTENDGVRTPKKLNSSTIVGNIETGFEATESKIMLDVALPARAGQSFNCWDTLPLNLEIGELTCVSTPSFVRSIRVAQVDQICSDLGGSVVLAASERLSFDGCSSSWEVKAYDFEPGIELIIK